MQPRDVLVLIIISVTIELGFTGKELARGKITSSSRLHAERWNSSNVVDGNNNTNVFCDSCLHTYANAEPSAFWQVDLDGFYTVNRVEIYSREPYLENICPSTREEYQQQSLESDRLKGYSIFISHDSNWTSGIQCYKEPSGPNVYPALYQNNVCIGSGSYLTIYTNHRATFGGIDGACLTICEVKVYGCESGTYGNNCEGTCPINCRDGTCDSDSGFCLQCEDGWTGSTCNETCPKYFYGNNCTEVCRNCNEDTTCIHTNGTCPNGCSDGWIGVKCDEACPDYTYGNLCNSSCGQCINDTVCIHTNGTCPMGCEVGYTGDTCKAECPKYTYGYNCLETCGQCSNGSTCHNVNGTCLNGCADGWLDDYCKTPCPENTYGRNCNLTCGLCKDNETCIHTNGSCSNGCEDGYAPPKCNTECPDGKYGFNCVEECGKCFNSSACNHVTGICASGECQAGWHGVDCKSACSVGYYGVRCNLTCGLCFNGGNCNNENGTCMNGCENGYKRPLCIEECDNGTYGRSCDFKCGNCFDGHTCYKYNGSCLNGCEEGWTGATCHESLAMVDNTISDTLMIGIIIGVVAFIVLAGIVVFVCKKRRKSVDKHFNTEISAVHSRNSIQFRNTDQSNEDRYLKHEMVAGRRDTNGSIKGNEGQARSNSAYSSDDSDSSEHRKSSHMN